jgi:hypothetical protein
MTEVTLGECGAQNRTQTHAVAAAQWMNEIEVG